MNLAPRWVQWLGEAGVNAVHWVDVGPPNATDATIFAYALQYGLIVFTHDLDFGALLAHTRAHGPSVIQVRAQDTSPEAIGSLILAALLQHAASLNAGALVAVDPSKARVRILPLR